MPSEAKGAGKDSGRNCLSSNASFGSANIRFFSFYIGRHSAGRFFRFLPGLPPYHQAKRLVGWPGRSIVLWFSSFFAFVRFTAGELGRGTFIRATGNVAWFDPLLFPGKSCAAGTVYCRFEKHARFFVPIMVWDTSTAQIIDDGANTVSFPQEINLAAHRCA